MRNIIAPALLITTALTADTLYLRNGTTVNGKLLSATSREIRFLEDGERTSQVHQVTAVDRITFGSGYTSQGQDSSRDNSRARTGSLAVPAGTVITVRMIDSINSDKTNVGDTYRASLDDPIVVDGRTVAPQGGDATVRIASVEQAGAIRGSEEITLLLNDVTVNGRRYTAQTEQAQVAAKSRGSESAKVIGGTAAVGAIIGAIAGGGKGAAIGAASGAGAGAAIQAIRGQRIQIPSETRLDFRLAEPMYID